jgi:hypothetical protein
VPDANQKSVNYKTLHDFDAILFYGIGELELTDQQKADVLSFIKEDWQGIRRRPYRRLRPSMMARVRRDDRWLFRRSTLEHPGCPGVC